MKELDKEVCVKLPVSGEVWTSIVQFVLAHRKDIEHGVNDYGDLVSVLEYFHRNDDLGDYFDFENLVFNGNSEVVEIFYGNLSEYPYPLPDSVKVLSGCTLKNYPHHLPDSVIELFRCDLENYPHPISPHVKIE